MLIDISGLDAVDQLIMRLKSVYSAFGFRKFRMARFESYDFYRENKSYLGNIPVITFSNPNGQLMALKPDITLSIIKSISDTTSLPSRLYYAENVYRPSPSGEYKEIFQLGVEHLGVVDADTEAQMLLIALKSLETISPNFVLCLSDTEYVDALVNTQNDLDKKAIYKAIAAKNIAPFRDNPALLTLVKHYADTPAAIDDLKRYAPCENARNCAYKLEKIYGLLSDAGYADHVKIDFSILGNRDYYKGLMFTGYIESVPNAVIKGGRYDPLVERLNKNTNGIGFAVYFDALDKYLRSKETVL